MNQPMSLDGFLNSESSSSCDNFDELDVQDFSSEIDNLLPVQKFDVLETPAVGEHFFDDTLLAYKSEEISKDETYQQVAFEHSDSNDNIVEQGESDGDDDLSMTSNASYMSNLRINHLKRNSKSIDSDEPCANAIVVKLSPRSAGFVSTNSRVVSRRIAETSRSVDTELSQRQKTVKKAASKNNCSQKTAANVRKTVSKSDDEDDEYLPKLKRTTSVSRSSKRVSNITLDENKNAVQARVNREKKKAYISTLEQQVDDLKSKNDIMRAESVSAVSWADTLAEEVAYLKAVLANQSALASLLKNINGDATMAVLSSSRFGGEVNVSKDVGRKRPRSDDHDYVQSQSGRKYSRGSTKDAGVCLHVNQERVTLEMCRHCSQTSNARKS